MKSASKRRHGSNKSAAWAVPTLRSPVDPSAEAAATTPKMERCVRSSPNLVGLSLQVDESAIQSTPQRDHQTPRSPLAHHSADKRRQDRRNTLSPAATTTTADGKSIFRSFQACYDMDLGPAVGTGGYAVVRRAVHRATGEIVAVKIMSLGRTPPSAQGGSSSDYESNSGDEDGSSGEGSDSDSDASSLHDMSISYQEVMNEIEMVARLDHPNVIRYREYFINPYYGPTSSSSGPPAPLTTKETSAAPVAVEAATGALGIDQPPPGSAGSSEGGATSGTMDGSAHGTEQHGVEIKAAMHVYIVMDLLEGPTLVDALSGRGRLTEADVKVVMGKLLDVVAYMHLQGVTHRDLKLENLVLKDPKGADLSSVTLIDFGLAKAARARERMQDFCGTLWYYAPELVRQVPFLAVVDEWALGVIMHVLLSGDFPFDAPDEDDLEDLILAGDLSHVTKAPTHDSPSSDTDDGSSTTSSASGGHASEVWLNVSNEAKDVLLGLLQPAMKKRLTAAQALEHPWFAVDGSRSFIGSHIWGAASSLNKSNNHTNGHIGSDCAKNPDDDDNVDNSSKVALTRAAGGGTGATAATLWHVHTRLDRLSSTARLPRRTYPAKAFLVDTLDYAPPESSSSSTNPAISSPAPKASGTGSDPTTLNKTPTAGSSAVVSKEDELPPPRTMRRSLSSPSCASLAALEAPAPAQVTAALAAAPTTNAPISSSAHAAPAAAAIEPLSPAVPTTPIVEVVSPQPEPSPSSQQAPLVFVVEEGVCEVVRVLEVASTEAEALNNGSTDGNDNTNGTSARYRFEHVGFRRKGSFVSADPRSYLPSQDELNQLNSDGGNRSVGGSRFAVRAATAVTVSVLEAADMQWAADHDYRLETELHRAMARRQRIIAQVLSAPPISADQNEGATSVNSPNRSSSSSSSPSETKSPHGNTASAAIGSPQRSPRAINGHNGNASSSDSPLGNGNHGQRKRSDSSADDIGVATMVAALGRGLRQAQPNTNSTSTSSSGDPSAGSEALLAAASPRALVGLAGELLKHMGGASPETQRRRFKTGLEVVLKEYFESGDMGEAARCLAELDAVCGFKKAPLMVKRAVSIALDRGPREKEMVATLLDALSPEALDSRGMEVGLAALAASVRDLSLDAPSAPRDVAVFLARACVHRNVHADFLPALAAEFQRIGSAASAWHDAGNDATSVPKLLPAASPQSSMLSPRNVSQKQKGPAADGLLGLGAPSSTVNHGAVTAEVAEEDDEWGLMPLDGSDDEAGKSAAVDHGRKGKSNKNDSSSSSTISSTNLPGYDLRAGMLPPPLELPPATMPPTPGSPRSEEVMAAAAAAIANGGVAVKNDRFELSALALDPTAAEAGVKAANAAAALLAEPHGEARLLGPQAWLATSGGLASAPTSSCELKHQKQKSSQSQSPPLLPRGHGPLSCRPLAETMAGLLTTFLNTALPNGNHTTIPTKAVAAGGAAAAAVNPTAAAAAATVADPALLVPKGGPKVSYYVPGGGPLSKLISSTTSTANSSGSRAGGVVGSSIGSTTIAERRAARAAAAKAAAAASEATAAGLWACQAPHFHHEFVFQLLMRAANSLSSDRTAAHGWVNRSPVASALLGLLASLVASGLVSSTQLRLGGLRADERAMSVVAADGNSPSSSPRHKSVDGSSDSSNGNSSGSKLSRTTADAQRLDRLRTLARELYNLEW